MYAISLSWRIQQPFLPSSLQNPDVFWRKKKRFSLYLLFISTAISVGPARRANALRGKVAFGALLVKKEQINRLLRSNQLMYTNHQPAHNALQSVEMKINKSNYVVHGGQANEEFLYQVCEETRGGEKNVHFRSTLRSTSWKLCSFVGMKDRGGFLSHPCSLGLARYGWIRLHWCSITAGDARVAGKTNVDAGFYFQK